MNKLLVLTTCITPLLFVNADAKLSIAETNQSVEISKPTDAKLDQYMRIKCNLPKISDQQIRSIANNALAAIDDIQKNISVFEITKSLQKYCVKDSAFGKIIEVAQDLVTVAKTYADFNTVIRLERISNKALDLYDREGVNFEALAKGTTDTPEYKENEDMFNKFMSKDLIVLRQIALQYADKPTEVAPLAPVMENKDPEKTDSQIFVPEVPAPIESNEPAMTLGKDPVLDKKISNDNAEIQAKPASIFAPKDESSDATKPEEKSIFDTAVDSAKGSAPFVAEEKQESKTEMNSFVAPVEEPKTLVEPADISTDSKKTLKSDLTSEPIIAQESTPEISQEKPAEISPFNPVEEAKEVTPAQSAEMEQNAAVGNNEENENPLLPHYFAGKNAEASKPEVSTKSEAETEEDKSESSERKSFWGF